RAVLATWEELIGGGRMLDGEANLAGTAKPLRALLGAATAAEIGVRAGDQVRVGGPAGGVVAPVMLAELPDGVVWLPTTAPGASVRRDLGAGAGDLVTLTPVTGRPR
ncbi:MAG: NADH-quinone oxidoreductase subunit G, partial [Actinomycetota bacterium]|nr:NADH-quinone oxidoreductase subunit G [Actinomycetota bacterium]